MTSLACHRPLQQLQGLLVLHFSSVTPWSLVGRHRTQVRSPCEAYGPNHIIAPNKYSSFWSYLRAFELIPPLLEVSSLQYWQGFSSFYQKAMLPGCRLY